jgi:hypothetical protein
VVGATADDDIDSSGEVGECRIIQADTNPPKCVMILSDSTDILQGSGALFFFLQKVNGMCVRRCVIGNKMLENVASGEARGFSEQDIQIGAGVGRHDCPSRRT